MAFRNIPPNGFPALPDVEDLEAVVKDVTSLKTSVSGLTEDVSDLNEQKANQITIASFFNSETSYDIGDLVYYNGLTYRCTNAHEGEWDADDFVGTTIANELDSLKSGLTNVLKSDTFSGTADASGNVSLGNAINVLAVYGSHLFVPFQYLNTTYVKCLDISTGEQIAQGTEVSGTYFYI